LHPKKNFASLRTLRDILHQLLCNILQSLSLHKEFEYIKITLLHLHYLLINIKYQLLKQNIYDII